MTLIYQTTITNLCSTDIDLTALWSDPPVPTPPDNSGWMLHSMSVGKNKIYYVWVKSI